jgi:hypothetical protein
MTRRYLGSTTQDYHTHPDGVAGRYGGSLLDYYTQPAAVAGRYGGSLEDYTDYETDQLVLASSGPDSEDQAVSPDGYSHVETNEFFECEDGVRNPTPTPTYSS